MKPNDCKNFESCSANLCPKIENGPLALWFPEEQICSLKEFSGLKWIQNQRKVAKRTTDTYGGFTLRMLEQNCVIGRGIKGIDPDGDLNNQERVEERWSKDHPEKKAKSKEQLDILRNRMAEFRRGLTSEKNDQSAKGNSKKEVNPLRVLEPNLPEQYQSATQTKTDS